MLAGALVIVDHVATVPQVVAALHRLAVPHGPGLVRRKRPEAVVRRCGDAVASMTAASETCRTANRC